MYVCVCVCEVGYNEDEYEKLVTPSKTEAPLKYVIMFDYVGHILVYVHVQLYYGGTTLSCNSKDVVYIIECSKRKEIYIGSTNALNTRTSLHRSNIQIEENRKLNVYHNTYTNVVEVNLK